MTKEVKKDAAHTLQLALMAAERAGLVCTCDTCTAMREGALVSLTTHGDPTLLTHDQRWAAACALEKVRATTEDVGRQHAAPALRVLGYVPAANTEDVPLLITAISLLRVRLEAAGRTVPSSADILKDLGNPIPLDAAQGMSRYLMQAAADFPDHPCAQDFVSFAGRLVNPVIEGQQTRQHLIRGEVAQQIVRVMADLEAGQTDGLSDAAKAGLERHFAALGAMGITPTSQLVISPEAAHALLEVLPQKMSDADFGEARLYLQQVLDFQQALDVRPNPPAAPGFSA